MSKPSRRAPSPRASLIKWLKTPQDDFTASGRPEAQFLFEQFTNLNIKFVEGLCLEVRQFSDDSAINNLIAFVDGISSGPFRFDDGREAFVVVLGGRMTIPNDHFVNHLDGLDELQAVMSRGAPANLTVACDGDIKNPNEQTDRLIDPFKFMETANAVRMVADFGGQDRVLTRVVAEPDGDQERMSNFAIGFDPDEGEYGLINRPVYLKIIGIAPQGVIDAEGLIDLVLENAFTDEGGRDIKIGYTIDGTSYELKFVPDFCGLPVSTFLNHPYEFDVNKFDEFVTQLQTDGKLFKLKFTIQDLNDEVDYGMGDEFVVIAEALEDTESGQAPAEPTVLATFESEIIEHPQLLLDRLTEMAEVLCTPPDGSSENKPLGLH